MLRSTRLQRLTASLSRARTAEEVYGVILVEGREALGADAGMVALPIDDDTALDVVATFGFTPEELAGWERIELSQRTPIGDAYAMGMPIVLEDGERERRFPDSGGRGAPTASVPLHTGERPIGALGFRFARRPPLQPGRPGAGLEPRRPLRAGARARPSVRRRAPRARGAGPAGDGRRAPRRDARPRRRAAHARVARRPGHLRPVRGRSRRERRDPAAGGGARRSRAAGGSPALEWFAPDLSSDTPVAVAIRTSTTQLVPLAQELPESAYRSPAHRAAVVAIGLRSMVSAPLVVRGRTIGALTFGWRRDHAFSPLDIDLAEQIARRVALALDNARLYDVQRDIAHTLQQSLLPGTLPQPPGIEIAARYRPSGEGAEVGGDFYDAWPLADGGFAIAIGDVAARVRARPR